MSDLKKSKCYFILKQGNNIAFHIRSDLAVLLDLIKKAIVRPGCSKKFRGDVLVCTGSSTPVDFLYYNIHNKKKAVK